MKIVYDFQIFQTQKYGGISRYYYELVSNLAKYPDLELFLFNGINQNAYNWDKVKSLIHGQLGIRVPTAVAQTKIASYFNYATFGAFQIIAGKRYDIYHPTYFPRVMLCHRKTKIIVTVHDMIHEIFPEHNRNDPTTKRKRKAVQQADLIICDSHSTAKDLMNIFSVDQAKIRVVHLGNSFWNVPFENNGLTGNNFVIHKPFLLYVGARHSYKNFERVLFSFLNDEHLQNDFSLVCFGAGPFKEKELNLIHKANAIGKVIHLQGDDKLLQMLYTRARALILPSLYEGFGLPLVEAMTLGCPILASNRSSIPEVLDGAGLMFDPMDQEEIIQAMKNLLYNDVLRQELIKKGKKRAEAFSWKKMAFEVMQIYKEIAR